MHNLNRTTIFNSASANIHTSFKFQRKETLHTNNSKEQKHRVNEMI